MTFSRLCQHILLSFFLLSTLVGAAFPKKLSMPVTPISQLYGEIELRAVMYPSAKEVMFYILHADDGITYQLIFNDKAPVILKTGMRVGIKQALRLSENKLSLNSRDLIIEHDNRNLAIVSPLGVQKTVVFLLAFQDNPTARPWTSQEVSSVMNTINDLFYESSYQKTTLATTILGFYVLPINSTSGCDVLTTNIPVLAEAAAKNAGVDLSAYTRRVFMFPFTSSCGWSGIGSVGANSNGYSTAWINGNNIAHLTGHELGHNLGLWHAHFLQCPGASIGDNCTLSEYGDEGDMMGYGSTVHFNASQKERLGWFSYQNVPLTQTVTASGRYLIYPLENSDTNIKALRILQRVRADGSKDYYFLEFRTLIGFDKNLSLCAECDFTKGVTFHYINDVDTNTSNLIDMTPNDNNILRVALLAGETYQDAQAANGGVKVTLNSISNGVADVNISFGTTPPPAKDCLRKFPLVSINPAFKQGQNGNPVTYTITVLNNDSGDCKDNIYNLSITNPNSKINAAISSNSVTLSPQKSTQVNLTLTPSNLIPSANYYNVAITTSDAAFPHRRMVAAAYLQVTN